MYNVTPVQYMSGAAIVAYALIVVAVVVFIFWLRADYKEVSGICILGLVLFATIGSATFIFTRHDASLYTTNRDNYDAIAVGREPGFSIKRSYLTARDISQVAGRPIGTASATGGGDDLLNNDSRPVSYLADDGYIRQGSVKLNRNGSAWTVTLYSLDGKTVSRPSHSIGNQSAMTAVSDDDIEFIMNRANNGITHKHEPLAPTVATMQSSSGNTVRITSGNGGLSMDDGRNPVQPVRLTILDGKAYATAAGAHFGKPITVG